MVSNDPIAIATLRNGASVSLELVSMPALALGACGVLPILPARWRSSSRWQGDVN